MVETRGGISTAERLEPPRGRLWLGGAVFVAGFLAPALIPLVTTSQLPGSAKTVLAGLLAFGIPEIGMLIAVVILGKPGYQYLKSKIKQGVGELLFPAAVGPLRHGLGVALLALVLLLAWVGPYFALVSPAFSARMIIFALVGDGMLLVALVLLGPPFWHRLAELFRYTPAGDAEQTPQAK
ncbi:MAG: hypothetical protein JSU82_06335 [Rhodospirillales bacterium]|nr:MAG: hypothetical protein JSU82_06335 [Rhodospirillales bacterium]